MNSRSVFAQSTSNKGTDFWVAYAGHIDGLVSRMTLFLSSDVNTTYQVKSGGVTIASGSITANIVTPVFIDPNQYDVYIASSDVKEVNKGISVTTGEPISLYCVISNNARTGSTLVLPTSALEQEYYVFSQQNTGGSNTPPYSEFTIVGVKDGTILEITPTQTNRNGTRQANSTFQITLNKGDVYQYQATNDLTGTLIKAITGCTPIAVFSGTTWSAYCEQGSSRTPSGGDNLYQQLFPVTAWGKNFVSAPFYNTLNGNTDIIKIIVSEDNTTITVNGSTTNANGTTLSNPYKKGSVITFYTKLASIIKASSPIAVVFKDKATVDFGEITKVEWFFDYANKTTPDLVDDQPNLRTQTAKEYSFNYPSFTNVTSKTYVVKMKVYSGGSCAHEQTQTITLYPEATVDFSLKRSCLINGEAEFLNLSSYVINNANLTYQWDFGDQNANTQNPNLSTEKTPFHRYTQAGKYNVSLTVKTPYGCSKTFVKEITIEGSLPVADFLVQNIGNLCSQNPVVFEDKIG